jgi:hypothetical protein
MKEFRWTVADSTGFDHEITLKTSVWTSKLTITVDGTETVVKPQGAQAMLGLTDHTLSVGDKTCHLVVLGRQADLAVDGQYLTSKRPYLPYMKRPKWVWIFWVLCIAVCIGGGAIPWLIGLTAAVQCGRTSVSPYIETRSKVLTCIGITVAAWVALFVASFAVGLLFALLGA